MKKWLHCTLCEVRDSLLTKRCDDVAANDEEASKYQEESRMPSVMSQ